MQSVGEILKSMVETGYYSFLRGFAFGSKQKGINGEKKEERKICQKKQI